MRDRVVCAVDGGATKTRAIVLDWVGVELVVPLSGRRTTSRGRAERVVTNVTVAVEQAIGAAGARLPIDSLWVGLAGIERPGAREAIEAQLTAIGP